MQLNPYESAETHFEYDGYGNVSKVTYPPNEMGEEYRVRYTYDNVQHKYVTEVSDDGIFGLSSKSEYDPKFDAVLESEDVTGNKIRYWYDAKGRPIRILGPKETGVSTYTVEYEYGQLYTPGNAGVSYSVNGYCVTKNYDPQDPANPIETISIADGLGRIIQVKKDIELDGQEKMSVSGLAEYDLQGRVVKQFHPIYEDKDNSGVGSLNNNLNLNLAAYYTTAIYDSRDRVVSATDEDGLVTTCLLYTSPSPRD